MNLSASDLSTFQRCARRHYIEHSYHREKWYPTSLFSRCMRRAIFELSNGMDPHTVTVRATNAFLAQARQPGFDGLAGQDTYTITMDFIATMKTIIEHLSRITLLTLRNTTPIPLNPGLSWVLTSPQDESGVLHRWKFVDYINDDNLIRECHSWEVTGDIAIARAPLTLHLVSIGRREGSHRNSPWCKTFRSPTIANHYRFQKKDGSAVKENWKAAYFAENTDNDASTWVDLLESDGVIDNLIRHINVKDLPEIQLQQIRYEIEEEGRRISSLGHSLTHLPMSRPACDAPYPCPHQIVCYSLDPVKVLREKYQKI